MSIHISAKPGEIAADLLLPGDPLRAKFIAETFFESPKLVNEIRGMYCFTGSYRGKPISVMGSGMGQPSLSIYVNELFRDYNVQRVIRVGSCGSIQPKVKVRDLILAAGACSTGNMNRRRFQGMDFAPVSDFGLLRQAHDLATAGSTPVHVGNVLATDSFYEPDADGWKMWATYQVLAIEMESAELLTLAAQFDRRALSILTVSDSLVDPSTDALQDRERGFRAMAELALNTLAF
ncbi:MAG: purine-nucleoside phosphorylase [Spirochaetales bacterium]|nr:purine-nucleoside phosphorylase [Spirochaetales bacterium]